MGSINMEIEKVFCDTTNKSGLFGYKAIITKYKNGYNSTIGEYYSGNREAPIPYEKYCHINSRIPKEEFIKATSGSN